MGVLRYFMLAVAWGWLGFCVGMGVESYRLTPTAATAPAMLPDLPPLGRPRATTKPAPKPTAKPRPAHRHFD